MGEIGINYEESLKLFEDDLNRTMVKLSQGAKKNTVDKLKALRDDLIKLYKKEPLKINHSVMELVCAKPLIEDGCEVDLEHRLSGGIACDVYAVKGDGVVIVEAETGFVPPNHAVGPGMYRMSRETSKIARYSGFADKFILGIPHYYIAQIPQTFLKPPRKRTKAEIKNIKVLCDLHYSSPPTTLDEVRNARLHLVYVMNVDKGLVKEFEPEEYIKTYPLTPIL